MKQAWSDVGENDDLWDYIENNCLFISKTVFALKTQFIVDKRDNLLDLRPTSMANTFQHKWLQRDSDPQPLRL